MPCLCETSNFNCEQGRKCPVKNMNVYQLKTRRVNELQRYVIEGPYRREERNPRLGLLIVLVTAIATGFGLWRLFS